MMWASMRVAGELTHDIERVGECAGEVSASRSRIPRCGVTASALAPHVAICCAAQLRSTSTAAAASWPGTRAPHVCVFLSCERWCAAAHATAAVHNERMLHEVLPCAVVTPRARAEYQLKHMQGCPFCSVHLACVAVRCTAKASVLRRATPSHP